MRRHREALVGVALAAPGALVAAFEEEVLESGQPDGAALAGEAAAPAAVSGCGCSGGQLIAAVAALRLQTSPISFLVFVGQ